MVQITVQMPDEIARRFSTEPAEIPRRILEAVATEGFRSAKLSREQVGELLRLDSQDADRFLGQNGIERSSAMNEIDAQQDRNFESFRAQLPTLLQTHSGKYVAFADGAMVDHDPDEWRLVYRVAAQFPQTPVMIQKVEGDGVTDVYVDTRDFKDAEGRAA